MNTVDILLGAIVLFSVIGGFRRGFIEGWVTLITWLGSLLIGLSLFDEAVGLLERWIPALGTWSVPVALLVTVLVVHLLLSALLHAFLREVDPGAHASGINKALGILPGILRGWISATIIAALLLALPIKSLLTDAARNSTLALSLSRQAGWLERSLSPNLKDALGKAVVRMPAGEGSHESVDLAFKVKTATARPELEREMLQLVNEERIKAGLQPLKADPQLLPVARAHSKDMFTRGYFAHINPEGLSPADRIRKFKVPFITAGENLALGPSLNRCHTGLMQSPGHRANILNPAFRRVGIAVLDGGFYGLMITQNFRN
ncbi:Cysteine-rich secretory protein family protein [Cnuella takakiae]|uniref:Cysteine-rich secretory protein family protein n=1 Tax=Cnuella takakiae TaxID=1302690 RepID=A0A1M4Y5X1_9BACT|nr:CvpA family protein [Cnuella takakiae]OLY93059.1 hypothetical protein BUE76_15020 [Cnuella takakiae]SHF01204.1 Cysteine-rich secretory protein family protein [Cnuella takakiae]